MTDPVSPPAGLGPCIVTGGAGAIGSRLVRRLLELNAPTVLVVDDLSSGYRWLLPDDPRLVFVEADVAAFFDHRLTLRDAHLFHLAAFFANQNSVDHPEADLHTNGLGTLRVLKWAAENRCRRVVYASAGCSIAGSGVQGEAIHEEMPVSLEMSTPYQITKVLGEFYCNYYRERVSTVRCRFFNSYGPGEVPGRYRNVIPNFIWWAMHHQPIPITGTGEETRDFIFVSDMVDGLIRCMTTPGAHGGAFNLGTGIETPVRELARLILELTGSRSEILHRPRREWDHCLRRQADISKARRILDHRPAVALTAGLAATVQWFREHREQIAHSVGDEL